MDASAKKRVLVASMAFVMILSAAAIFFHTPQTNGNANTDQSPSYLVEYALPGNGLINEPANQAMAIVSEVPQTYQVTFTSIGYQQGLLWAVTVDGTNTVSTTLSSISFELSNGTHSFAVENNPNYLAAPASGVVMVYGSPVTQYITFSIMEYELKFMESSLPAGSSWSVNLSGELRATNTDSIHFSVGNGTYSYTVTGPANYASTPASGTVVVYGENKTVDINFVSTLHKITFNFNGETSGTSWELNLAGDLYTVSGSSLSVNKPNGIYDYSISTESEYVATPSVGSVLVLESDASQNISIQFKTYTVTFEHVGMSAGTAWAVTMAGVTHNSTSSVITFEIPAGNYTFEVTGANGYSVASNDGYVNVASQDQHVSLNFTKNTDYLTGTLLLVGGAVIGIAAGIGIGVYISRKK